MPPARARRFDSPFVGRERQRAGSRRRSRTRSVTAPAICVTVLGTRASASRGSCGSSSAGSPLTRRCCAAAACPYGEGITYWPLAEVVREIARAAGPDRGAQTVAALAQLLPGEEKAELIAELVAQALGFGGAAGGTSEETFWAVRRLFEALARAGPARGRPRRPPLGGADVPRSRSRTSPTSRADSPILLVPRAAGAPRQPPGLGRRQPNATPICSSRSATPMPRADLQPARPARRCRPPPERDRGAPPRATRSSPRSFSRCSSTTRCSPGRTAAGSRPSDLPSCPCPRPSMPFSPPVSRACPPTSARSSPRVGRGRGLPPRRRRRARPSRRRRAVERVSRSSCAAT